MTNRDKFQGILERAGITQKEAATYIEQQTSRPCSHRTVQSWLNDPEKPSSRPCPDWAISSLETKLKELGKVV